MLTLFPHCLHLVENTISLVSPTTRPSLLWSLLTTPGELRTEERLLSQGFLLTGLFAQKLLFRTSDTFSHCLLHLNGFIWPFIYVSYRWMDFLNLLGSDCSLETCWGVAGLDGQPDPETMTPSPPKITWDLLKTAPWRGMGYIQPLTNLPIL